MSSFRFQMVSAAAAMAICQAALTVQAGAMVQVSEIVQGEVRPGWRAADGTHMAALHIRLAPGWKTYWRAPGDTGIAPRFDLSGSQNIQELTLHWPRPVVFDQLGGRGIGYRDELVLPMQVTLADAAAPARLSAEVEIGVCESICIPVTLQVSADLPASGARDSVIEAALSRAPVSGRSVGLNRHSCRIEPIPDGLRITADLDLPRLGANEVAIFELSDPGIWISESRTRREDGRLTASAELVPPAGAPFALDRSDLRITLLGDDQAAEIMGCPAG